MDVSVVGFGGIPIQRLSMEEAERVLAAAVEHGINFFDSARAYSDSEEKMGRGLSPFRARIFLATKSLAKTRRDMAREIDSSLKGLRTDSIDLYQVHNVRNKEVLDQVLGKGGAMEALEEAKEKGKVRSIGVTGHNMEALARAVKTGRFEAAQIPFNAIETEWETKLVPLCRERGMGVIAMKPLAGGALRPRVESLRYVLTRGATVAIPGMDAVEQVKENVKAGEKVIKLTKKERKVLLEEKERLGERFCRRCEYCLPCTQGLNIPFILLLGGYADRYGLRDWALERYRTQAKGIDDCQDCGECEEKCPYHLPVREMLREAKGHLLGG